MQIFKNEPFLDKYGLEKAWYKYLGVNVKMTEFLDGIKNGYEKEKVEEIRLYEKHGLDGNYDRLKSKRALVSMHSIFDSYNGQIKRQDNNFLKFSGYIGIDIDDIKFDINKINKNEVYCIYRSVGGKGYTIIVRVDINGMEVADFKATYQSIVELLNIKQYFDAACCDYKRLFYISYDPDIYINTTGGPLYPVVKSYKPTKEVSVDITINNTSFGAAVALVNIEGDCCYNARTNVAHALYCVYGSGNDVKNYYDSCVSLGGKNRVSQLKDYSSWGNAISKDRTTLDKLEQLRVLKRYLPHLIEWLDIKQPPNIEPIIINKYLTEDLDNLLSFIDKNDKIIIDSPPGTGKTTILRLYVPNEYERVTLTVPTKNLAHQQGAIEVIDIVTGEVVPAGDIEIVTGVNAIININVKVLIICYAAIPKAISQGRHICTGGGISVLAVDEAQHLSSDVAYRPKHMRDLVNSFDLWGKVILFSGTPINLHLLPGFKTIQYKLAVTPIIQLHYNYNEPEIIRSDIRKMLFLDDTELLEYIADDLNSNGNLTVVSTSQYPCPEMTNIVSKQLMEDIQSILSTRGTSDGINMNDLYHKLSILLSKHKGQLVCGQHLAFTVQSLFRWRIIIDPHTGEVLLQGYLNKEFRGVSTYIELDFEQELNRVQVLCDYHNHRRTPNINNNWSFQYDEYIPKEYYYDRALQLYRPCTCSILYNDMINRSKTMNEVEYLATFGITLVDDNDLVYYELPKKTKKLPLVDFVTTITMLFQLLEIDIDWDPIGIKAILDLRYNNVEWTKPMTRYLRHSELGQFYPVSSKTELVAIANIESDIEYERAKSSINYRSWKAGLEVLPLTQEFFKKSLLPLEIEFEQFLDQRIESVSIYRRVSHYIKLSKIKQSYYLNVLFNVEKRKIKGIKYLILRKK